MIKDFKPRLYQETILATCVEKNTLVVLPTGMGKTAIALMLTVQRLRNYPKSKILFLAPTKPLAEQHMQYFKKYLELDDDKFVLFTGNVKPELRQKAWDNVQLIFSTPQGMENDIISSRIKLEDVSLLIFDEAHRAVGDYAYNFIAKQYDKLAKYPKILALTASPGSEIEKINEVVQNLFIEEVEVRTDEDPDVKPYIKEIKMQWVNVELPEEFKEIKKFLEACFKEKITELKKHTNLGNIDYYSKKDILALQAQLHGQIASGERDFEILRSVSLVAEAMKVQHALELLETQGISPLIIYMEKLQMQAATTKVKAVKNLVRDLNFRSAFVKIKSLVEKKIEHPKLDELKRIVKEETGKNKDVKIIVFNQYRDNAVKIVEELGKIEGVTPRIFVGQVKKGETGLSQKKQIELLNQFRQGEFNVLVSTSVGEEGLDIPKVDIVIFYEPIPSAIRHIQRRGRTGRLEEGAVVVLMAKHTRDEAYKWSAFHKEKRMYRTLNDLRKNLIIKSPIKEKPLTSYTEEKVKVFADYREKGSNVVKELLENNVDLKLEKIEVGDFVLSSRVAVEYKTTFDFVDSIIDGRLLQQVKLMKQSFERPVVIVEGIEDLYSLRKVHPNAIQGMLATIAVSYGIPMLFTKNFRETSSILRIIAKREQDETSKDFTLHAEKRIATLKEQQEYVVSSLPGIGAALAKPLLEKFKTIKRLVNASEEQLKKVDLIGEKKAKAIKDVFEKEYEGG